MTTKDVTKNDTKENSIGIPKAEFVENVKDYMERPENDNNASKVIRKLDEDHSKYRFMGLNLIQKKRRLKRQIPDIKESLNIINLMKTKLESEEQMQTNFLLSDQVFMQATIKPSDKICLWLGANVMLEYTIDEAEELLIKNLNAAQKNLAQIDMDLSFLRDQITTTELNNFFYRYGSSFQLGRDAKASRKKISNLDKKFLQKRKVSHTTLLD